MKRCDVPVKWGMFTLGGNNRLRQLALKFWDEVRVISATDFGDNHYVEGKGPRTAEMKAADKFYSAWRKMSDFKSYREASDTAVREQVWCFSLGVVSFAEEGDLDEVWDGRAAFQGNVNPKKPG